MYTYYYQALTNDEQVRTGDVVAKSAAAALEQLESQGLTVLLLRQAEASLAESETRPRAQVASDMAGEQLLHQRVADLLERRETLGPALAAFAAELPAGSAQRDLKDLAERIQTGATTEELTCGRSLVDIWLPLAGGGSSIGSGHLQNLLAEAQRGYANRAYIARGLAYPLVVLLVALGVVVFLGIVVVPTFTDVFQDFDLALPQLTLFVVGFSESLVHRPLQCVAAIAAVILLAYGVVIFVRRWILPARWAGMFWNGNSQQVAEMATFVQRIAEALKVGMPLAEALLVVGMNSRHNWLRWEAMRVSDELRSGADSRAALQGTTLPPTVSYALQAGPLQGPHVALLESIAEAYYERVRSRFKWSSGFLPQLAMIGIGLVVAIVVLALFLPLVGLINALSG